MSHLSRRRFLRVGGSLAAAAIGAPAVHAGGPKLPVLPRRTLGKTGLEVSVVGFGGHSWSYARVPDANGKKRRTSQDEAKAMIQLGLDMGVNYFDGCTPYAEHDVPGKALHDLGKRKDVVICCRNIHKMKGVKADKKVLHDFIDERLKAWRTDYVDIMFAGMATEDYWDMSYAVEALDEIKRKGQARFTGFGSHFSPANYREAIRKYGEHFDICSMPYNVRHRAGEEVFPHADRAKLGIVTIKPFARGSLFKAFKADEPKATDADLAAKMIRFVVANRRVDVCLCGVHTLDHVRQNFAAAARPMAAAERRALDRLAHVPTDADDWLEHHWVASTTA
ncbi:aldo/keto reductase [Planctomycetota bacterium]